MCTFFVKVVTWGNNFLSLFKRNMRCFDLINLAELKDKLLGKTAELVSDEAFGLIWRIRSARNKLNISHN